VRKVLTEEELYPFHNLGYQEIGEEELGVMTCELARLQDAKKDLWIDKLQIPVRNRKDPLQLK
jgi:hypothetical protein